MTDTKYVLPDHVVEASAKARAKFPGWSRYAAVGVVALVIGLGMGNGHESTTAAKPAAVKVASQPEKVDVVTTPEYLALVAERDKAVAERDAANALVEADKAADASAAQAEADAAAAAAAPAGLSNGQYIVGSTMEAGRYTMTVEPGLFSLAYVDQQNGDDYLAQEVAGDEGSTLVVDIKNVPGSIVTFQGVTGITKVG